jgi:hypothetical protein
MAAIWKDPVGWAALAVATPTRFWLTISAIVFVHALVILQSFIGVGIFSGIVFLCWFQCLFIYALRRLYQELRLFLSGPNAA